jgi:hypothetical protein
VSGVAIQGWLIDATLLVGLCIFLFIKLRRADYNFPIAALISGLVFLQPAFCNTACAFKAGLFAAIVYAVAVSAVSVVERYDVRRIALLGGSLAGAQLVHPLWGTAATVMLPFALRNRLDEESSAAGATGLYVTILFIPVLTAAAMFFFDASVRSEIFSLARIHHATAFTLSRSINLIATVLVAATPALIGFVEQPVGSSPQVIAVVSLTLVVVCTVLSMLDLQFATVSVGFGVLTVLLVSGWKKRKGQSWWALCLVTGNTAAGWTSLWLAQIYA